MGSDTQFNSRLLFGNLTRETLYGLVMNYTKRAQKRVKDETVENEERSLVERRTWTDVEDEGDEIQELEKRLR